MQYCHEKMTRKKSPVVILEKEKKREVIIIISDDDKEEMPIMKMKVKNKDTEETKIQTITNNNKLEKRKTATMIIKKEKKMQTDEKDKIAGGYNRGKEKNVQGNEKRQKVHSGDKESMMNVPLAFFKVVLDKFKEFLEIPPAIAPKLACFIDHHVYLEDSEGKSSKIMLSVVEGSLALCQGWNNFVSDHLINCGDFIVFDYKGMSRFSVRVFGSNSSERVCFNIQREDGTKKRTESHAPDNLVPCHRGGNYQDINGRHSVSGERPGSKWPETKPHGNNFKTAPHNLVAESQNAAPSFLQPIPNERVYIQREDGTTKRTESHAPDNLVPCHRGGNYQDINGRHSVSGERPGSKWPETKPHGNYFKTAPDNLVAESRNAAPSCRQPMPYKTSKFGNTEAEIDHSVGGEEHHFIRQEDGKKSSNRVSSEALFAVKGQVLESGGHSVLKANLQFCIPSTTQRWLELPNLLSDGIRRKGKKDRSIIMLKDPMKRLWPVFYHENFLVGFTTGWKRFAAANSLETGDICTLLKDLDEDEAVYHVNITKKQ